MSRTIRILLAALAVVCLTATTASARPPLRPDRLLGALWTYLLETPASANPFTGGDPCVRVGGVVTPFVPLASASTLECTVRRGTPLFVTAVSFECSTVEAAPFYGRNPPELRRCASQNLAAYAVHTLSVDGRPVPLVRVETAVLAIRLPKDNIIPTSARHALSVGAAWAAVLKGLPPGTHTLVIHDAGPGVPDVNSTTTIHVLSRN